ncbi:MAG TPA: hypothetical protein VGM81_02670 [Burkholderiaceae bacterium]|jgi:hypothetical protein
MKDFPTISNMLRTVYNAEDGLSEDASIRLYQRASATGDNRAKLEAELRSAFSRDDVSWRQMLCNDDYEVADIETEDEARTYAHRLLWEPFFGKGGHSQAEA